MNVFQIVNNLYTNKDGNWILSLDDFDIQPFIIQRFLVMNDKMREIARYLDKYTFYLPSKMYLSLAWSIIPKYDKAPFIKYISKEKKADEEEFDFILVKIRKHLELSDHDYDINKARIIELIKSDMPRWFRYYVVPKKHWTHYSLDYDSEMKKEIKQNNQKNIWDFV